MFLRHNGCPGFPDLSLSVRDATDWKIGILKDTEFPLDITVVTFDPVSCLLAIGTARGIIHLHGGPGVVTRLLLPEALPVRFLQFGLLTERLVCIDSSHYLHVWDLSPMGSPKYMAKIQWDPITFMMLSPSHNHIFISLINGEVKSFDLACMQKSPYALPNMWRFFEEQRLKTELPLPCTHNSTCQPVELVHHPRNLNLLFIAYEDGVVLVDLKDRKAIRNFDLVLPPGAPGGQGYCSQDIMLPRRSSVTCIAIHPAGHFFAVGHTDGSIAFWASENSDQPILVRTLDDLDVNLVDPEALEAHIGKDTTADLRLREPIFKVCWSGFENSKDLRGETALTVLGGTEPDKGFGLNVLWFPAFNPEDLHTTSSPVEEDGLHFVLTTIRQSLAEMKTYHYSTYTSIQDFYLIPHDNPHFNYTYNPYAILILSEVGQDERLLEAREFPPIDLSFQLRQSQMAKVSQSEDNQLGLDFILEDLSTASLPQLASLPYEFSGGKFARDAYKMQVIPKDVYQDLLSPPEIGCIKPRVRLSAGSAVLKPSLEGARTKNHIHRVLVCANRDLTVSFYDFSDRLQETHNNSPLTHDFPEAIDPLELDVQVVLDVIDSERSPEGQGSRRTITAVHFVSRTQECVIALNTGELLVYHPKNVRTVQQIKKIHDIELQLLKNITVEPWKKLAPYFALRRIEGETIVSIAVSEIGFVATAYSDGALYIIDMRGPSLLHGPTKSRRRPSRSSKHSFSIHHIVDFSSEIDTIVSLTWTISPVDNDPKPLLRLIAIHLSGNKDVYTISQSHEDFKFEGPVTFNKVMPNPLPNGTFVVDAKTGASCKADRQRFMDVLHEKEVGPVVLVAAGMKGVRSFLNITGERLGKAEWSTKFGAVIGVQIVERLGSSAFVVLTNNSTVHVYSLPCLEHICSTVVPATLFSSTSIDESGHFINFDVCVTTDLVQSSKYGTLFNFSRTEDSPLVDLTMNKGRIPSQPQPVPIGRSSFRSWFQSSRTMSGQQIDELLGGPRRPEPIMRSRDTAPQKDFEDSTEDPGTLFTAFVRPNLDSQLMTTMNERGQILEGLEESLKSMEQGSKDMLLQAKKLAAQSSTKSWFGF